MGSLNLPVRDQTCLRSLLWFALQLMDTQDLDIMVRDPLMLNQRLNQRLRLMLDFCMEDMDMVLVWDMLVWDIVVLATLDTDMVLDLTDTLDLDLMDTLDLDIMARDPLMLNQRPRLMLDFCMEDMGMVLVWDMLV